jgi:GNAT superfamily N-acetyltransferase
MAELELKFSDEVVSDELRNAATNILIEHSIKSGGLAPGTKSFSVLAYISQDLVGGLIGNVAYNWLYAHIVWVEEPYRGRGIGATMMHATEKRAREMSLTAIQLWTQSWQAPGFYEKVGYTRFAELSHYPPGHSRIGFFKYLQ